MGGTDQVIGIFLDGYEPSLEAAMRANGELPNLAALAAGGTTARLEHGPAQRTGLAGEHVSTGLSPDAAGRHAAVDFDPQTYAARQIGTRLPAFVEYMDAPAVVFDAPYFDLARAQAARGIVNWGAHDPGVPTSARPESLLDELRARFGPYPAPEFLYCTPWSSVELSARMGESLAAAVDTRREASLWLLRDRLPDWRFALISVSESHSAIEGLWHGIDPEHRLAGVPSAQVAGDGVRAVYRAIDRLVGGLVEAFPAATVVVFSMHGMGANTSDVASTALLPELLYRHSTGQRRLCAPLEWTSDPDQAPMVESSTSWSATLRQRCWLRTSRPLSQRARSHLSSILQRPRREGRAIAPTGLEWMPASWYQDVWPTMPVFALPSYYDGRVRVNLVDRERDGIVPLARYEHVLDEVEDLIRACVDPATGESVVSSVERIAADRDEDPQMLGPSDSDLVVVWNGPLAFDHPELGLIGPLPFKRTGGHSAPHGSVVITDPDIRRQDLGTRSAFDVVPTFFSLLGQVPPAALSGTSMLASRT